MLKSFAFSVMFYQSTEKCMKPSSTQSCDISPAPYATLNTQLSITPVFASQNGRLWGHGSNNLPILRSWLQKNSSHWHSPCMVIRALM